MIGFDTLHAAETLTDAGIEAAHAKAIVAAMTEAVGEPINKADLEPLATKADLERFATTADLEPLATKADLEHFATTADLEAAIEPLAAKADVAAVRAEVSELKATLTWRIVLALGAFAALVRLMP